MAGQQVASLNVWILILALSPYASVVRSQELLKLQRTIETGDGHCRWVAFHPSDNLVASCGDRWIQLFDVDSGQRVQSLEGHGSHIHRFDFSADGQQVASAGDDGTVRVWEVSSGKSLAVLNTGHQKVIGVAFSTDSEFLVATGTHPREATVAVYRCENWEEVARQAMPSGTNAMYAAFSPAAKQIVTSGYRGSVRRYAFTGKELRLVSEDGHRGGEMVPHVAFNRAGDRYVTSGWDRKLKCWHSDSGKLAWEADAPAYARCFEAAVFTPDDRRLFAVTRDETIQMRLASDGTLLASFRWQDEVRGFDLSPDARRLATAGHRGHIKIWEIQDVDLP